MVVVVVVVVVAAAVVVVVAAAAAALTAIHPRLAIRATQQPVLPQLRREASPGGLPVQPGTMAPVLPPELGGPAKVPGAAVGGAAPVVPGAAGDSNVPKDVMAQAAKIAHLGPDAVGEYMKGQGYPKNSAWCGDFAATTLKASGHADLIPQNPSIASNWRNVGPEVSAADAQPGDIAVRRPEFHGRLGTGKTGDTGSHVTIYSGAGSKKGQSSGDWRQSRCLPERHAN